MAKLMTEDLGKMFEKAICIAYEIPYVGKYKYSEEWPITMAKRLSSLKELYSNTCVHCAIGGGRYDYHCETSGKHLSAKTSKRAVAKVAPQVIGQCQPRVLAEYFGITFDTNESIKKTIRDNPIPLLKLMEIYTFDSDIVYYNQARDQIKYIVKNNDIPWNSFTYSLTNDWVISGKKSTTIKVKSNEKWYPLVEVQIHDRSRTNMAIRWYFDNILNIFSLHFTITILSSQ
jgi:hypothetical protein